MLFLIYYIKILMIIKLSTAKSINMYFRPKLWTLNMYCLISPHQFNCLNIYLMKFYTWWRSWNHEASNRLELKSQEVDILTKQGKDTTDIGLNMSLNQTHLKFKQNVQCTPIGTIMMQIKNNYLIDKNASSFFLLIIR